ncbi:unnamed protein product [Closterium sp. Naga37s-1]|nr:unnamed protein product [Closterium sp. Naga37s-1]
MAARVLSHRSSRPARIDKPSRPARIRSSAADPPDRTYASQPTTGVLSSSRFEGVLSTVCKSCLSSFLPFSLPLPSHPTFFRSFLPTSSPPPRRPPPPLPRLLSPASSPPPPLLRLLSPASSLSPPRLLLASFPPPSFSTAVLNYRGLVWRLLLRRLKSLLSLAIPSPPRFFPPAFFLLSRAQLPRACVAPPRPMAIVYLTAKSSPSASVFASGNETQEETSEASQDSGGNATWGFFEQSQDSARTTWEARDVSKTTRGESTGGELAATSDAEGAESDRAVGMSRGWRKWRGHVAREERPLGQRRQMGVNTPIVVHRGSVGVIVRNNYVHDFLFAGIRCGSDAHYAGDCMLTQIDRNLVVASGRNRSGDQDAAGIYYCVHWFSPDNTAECNYVFNGDHCYYLDFVTSGVAIKGGACINTYDGIKVNNGKWNRVDDVILKKVPGSPGWSACLTPLVLNCDINPGTYWELMRKQYYDTPVFQEVREKER